MLISACFDVGKDYHPADNIDMVPSILTPSACQAECQKLPECQYWTLNTNEYKCYRKGSKPATPLDISFATSGPKYCQPGKTFRYSIIQCGRGELTQLVLKELICLY